MAIFEAVLRQSVVGQAVINRFNYVSSGSEGSALPSFALAIKLGITLTAGEFETGSILRYLQFMTSLDLKFLSMQVRNIYDPSDFWEVIFTAGTEGEDTGRVSAPFLAFGAVSNQTRLDIGKGHKRFSGVAEEMIDPGGVLNSTALTNLNSLTDHMGDILTYTDDGASLAFAPTVVAKQKYLSHTSPDRYSYKYYATETLQLEHIASPVEWSSMGFIRSQVSRQYNRGA